MKDLGPCSWFLSMKVERDEERRTISILQEAFINKAPTASDMLDCKRVTSPMIVNSKFAQIFSLNSEPIFVKPNTRVYRCYKKNLQIPQDTKDYKLVYHSGHRDHIKLEIYTDADWAGDIETSKSTLGYVALLNGTAISWYSKRQTTVAQSLCEAEYIFALEAVKVAVCIGRFLEQLHQIRIYPIPIYCDNQGAIALAKNPENHQQTKHIDMRYHYIREKEEDGTIEIRYFPTE